jgi:hypothetical protein
MPEVPEPLLPLSQSQSELLILGLVPKKKQNQRVGESCLPQRWRIEQSFSLRYKTLHEKNLLWKGQGFQELWVTNAAKESKDGSDCHEKTLGNKMLRRGLLKMWFVQLSWNPKPWFWSHSLAIWIVPTQPGELSILKKGSDVDTDLTSNSVKWGCVFMVFGKGGTITRSQF